MPGVWQCGTGVLPYPCNIPATLPNLCFDPATLSHPSSLPHWHTAIPLACQAAGTLPHPGRTATLPHRCPCRFVSIRFEWRGTYNRIKLDDFVDFPIEVHSLPLPEGEFSFCVLP